jgi:hypothetical protein
MSAETSARSRTRTGTACSRPTDFKSVVSTYFTIRAQRGTGGNRIGVRGFASRCTQILERRRGVRLLVLAPRATAFSKSLCRRHRSSSLRPATPAPPHPTLESSHSL